MFLRISKLRNYRYMQVVYSKRVDKESKQCIVSLLGRYDEEVYAEVKKRLKDWTRLGRAEAVILEIEKGDF